MTARLVAGVLAVASLSLVGCGAKEGQRVIGFDRGGNRIQEKKASETGRYTLHAPHHAEVTYRVEKGERIGFRRGREGYVEAYAGDNPELELDRADASSAYWQFERKATE
jgi:hypothetical protein